MFGTHATATSCKCVIHRRSADDKLACGHIWHSLCKSIAIVSRNTGAEMSYTFHSSATDQPLLNQIFSVYFSGLTIPTFFRY